MIGGALLMNSIRGMFGGQHGQGTARFDPGGSAATPWGPKRQRQRSRARGRRQRHRRRRPHGVRRRRRHRSARACSTLAQNDTAQSDVDDADYDDDGDDFDDGGDSDDA